MSDQPIEIGTTLEQLAGRPLTAEQRQRFFDSLKQLAHEFKAEPSDQPGVEPRAALLVYIYARPHGQHEHANYAITCHGEAQDNWLTDGVVALAHYIQKTIENAQSKKQAESYVA